MRPALIVIALGVAAALAACSPGPMIDRMPEGMGGLPAGAPARPAMPYQYPAVHDMPPARATSTMSEDEQLKLEKELAATRDRQEGRERRQSGSAPAKNAQAPAKTAAPAAKPQVAKKKPGDIIVVPPPGAKTP